MIWKLLRTGWFLFAMIAVASGQAVSVGRGVDVPGVWAAERPLYVKGDLGVPRERLDQFSRWLSENAPNWTVVLLKNAGGEDFTDASGQRFSGMDAVEHAMGKTLPSATAFGDFTHPETGEKNGAFFILYLDERKLAYHALDAYDRRALGEDHWEGNLDAPAISAMRGGGRILDAAKDTITNIDRELERRIRQAREAQAREVERARLLKEETRAAISGVRQRLGDLEARLEVLRRDFNQPPGDLANPPVGQWSARLAAAERAVVDGIGDAAGLTREAAGQIDAHLRALYDHEAAPVRMRDLQARMDELRLHGFSAAAQQALLQARESLRSAEDAHARAESDFGQHAVAAEQALARAVRSDAATREEVARLERLEKRAAALGAATEIALLKNARTELEVGGSIRPQLDRADAGLRKFIADVQRRELTRLVWQRALIAGAVLGLIALLVAGWLGNRRRRPARQRALDLYAGLQTKLRERVDGLFELMDRTTKTVGSADTLERSGWTGETRQLAGQTLADVDRLFILASGIDRVLEKADGLIHPTCPLARMRNFLSSRNYLRALDLLEHQAVRFSPDDPLMPIVHGGRPAPSEWRGLLGNREEEAPFSLTFRELDDAFRERAGRALVALDQLERCWPEAQEALEKLDATLAAIEADEREIFDAGLTAGVFRVAPLFEQLLPAARSDREQAVALAATDPVAALADEIPNAERKTSDAADLCGLARQVHSEILPALEAPRGRLIKGGRRVAWMGDQLDDFSNLADHLAENACVGGVAGEVQELARQVADLPVAAGRAVDLNDRAAATCVPAMNQARLRTDRERQRLGRLLGVAPDQILRESPDMDPALMMDQAARLHAAGLAEIDLGDVAAAAKALDACEQLCQEAQELMDATHQAHEEAGSAVDELDREIARISLLLPAAAAALVMLQRDWSPTALLCRSADPAFPDPQRGVGDCFREADALLQRAQAAIRESEGKHRAGRILHAAGLREEAEAGGRRAEEQLAAVHAHAAAIGEIASQNGARLAELEIRFGQLEISAKQERTMYATLCEFEEVSDQLRGAVSACGLRGASANPFEAAGLLALLAGSMETVERMIQEDLLVHEEAARSLDAAERELSAARRLAHQSQTDQIPDSSEILRGLQSLEWLEQELAEARALLAVPHGDWQALDATADRLTGEAARLSGELRGELKLAEQTMEALLAATAKVRAASSWLGSHGLGELEAARAGLAGGNYQLALASASHAFRAAERAIQAAEEEARRKRREDERRREQARRRQMTSSSFSSSSRSSGFGSRSGASRSSFSSSSGSRRSSFSSGSGTRRSGW